MKKLLFSVLLLLLPITLLGQHKEAKRGYFETLNAETIILSGYTRSIHTTIGAAVKGGTAPDDITVGTFRGYGFNADAEVAFFHFDIPDDWDEQSDVFIVFHWFSETGDAIAEGEKVIWDATYRSIPDDVAMDNGTAVTVSDTLIGGASEIAKQHYHAIMTLDYDNANQPLGVGDEIGVQFDRNVTGEAGNAYSGNAILFELEVQYTSIGIH
jgi:hypothetical protein